MGKNGLHMRDSTPSGFLRYPLGQRSHQATDRSAKKDEKNESLNSSTRRLRADCLEMGHQSRNLFKPNRDAPNSQSYGRRQEEMAFVNGGKLLDLKGLWS
jgi:hypothetical protein